MTAMREPAQPTGFGVAPWRGQAARFGVLGVPHGVPYGMVEHAATAPFTIREASQRLARHLGNYDFDLEGTVSAEMFADVVDAGNVVRAPAGTRQHNVNRRAVNELLAAGVVPIVLGGDHSISHGTIAAVAAAGPLHLVQFDAHLDFRDEVNGVRDGLSSSIRRASELPNVHGITQIGLRGVGSAREDDLIFARAAGNRILSAREANNREPALLLAEIPRGVPIYITFDMDGFDPAIAPGVIAPSFGGLTWETMLGLLVKLLGSHPLAGMDIVEVAPERDPTGITCLLAARVIWCAIALQARV